MGVEIEALQGCMIGWASRMQATGDMHMAESSCSLAEDCVWPHTLTANKMISLPACSADVKY